MKLVVFLRPTQWKGGALFNVGERASFDEDDARKLIANGHAQSLEAPPAAAIPAVVVTKSEAPPQRNQRRARAESEAE